jgi:hypothetical protein
MEHLSHQRLFQGEVPIANSTKYLSRKLEERAEFFNPKAEAQPLCAQTKENPRQFPAGGSLREVSDDRDQKLR